MSSAFKDPARHLRDKPAVRWPGHGLLDRIWVVTETVARAGFPVCPQLAEAAGPVTVILFGGSLPDENPYLAGTLPWGRGRTRWPSAAMW